MIPHLDPYDVDVYPELLQLNQERGRLHLEHGVVLHPSEDQLPSLLKDGYFIQVSPMTDKNKNTHFETHIVYACSEGCCYFIEADSLDMRNSQKYYNFELFKAHMPKTLKKWKWYSMEDIHDITGKLANLHNSFRRDLVKRILGIDSEDVVNTFIEQVQIPQTFNLSDFMGKN